MPVFSWVLDIHQSVPMIYKDPEGSCAFLQSRGGHHVCPGCEGLTMEATLTAEGVLKMAMEMEQTGRIFYEALASGTDDARAADLFIKLAKAEAAHLAKFREMSAALTAGQTTMRWTNAQVNEFHQMVTANIQPTPHDVRNVALGGTVTDAVALARKMEQDAIDFYTRMLDVVDADSAETIEQIIQSERSHLRDLVTFAWNV